MTFSTVHTWDAFGSAVSGHVRHKHIPLCQLLTGGSLRPFERNSSSPPLSRHHPLLLVYWILMACLREDGTGGCHTGLTLPPMAAIGYALESRIISDFFTGQFSHESVNYQVFTTNIFIASYRNCLQIMVTLPRRWLLHRWDKTLRNRICPCPFRDHSWSWFCIPDTEGRTSSSHEPV